MEAILKYDKSIYEEKISQMELLAAELQQHLTTLEGKRDALKTFWDDTDGEKYFELISNQILKVQNAINQINRLKITYNDILGGLTSTSALVGGIIDDVTFGLKSAITLGGGGSAQAKEK